MDIRTPRRAGTAGGRRGSSLAAALASFLCATPAAADPLGAATVSVQAVKPLGDGRARVVECSGALIAPDMVLTAGHCLDGVDKPSQVAVFLYEGQAPRPAPIVAAAFARHPDHVGGWREKAGDPATRQKEIAADLALLRLPAAAAAGVSPAALAADPYAAATEGAIAGAGQAGPGGRSGRMKRASLRDVRMSTGGGGRVAFASAAGTVCGGDSGGPAARIAPGGAPEVWGVVAAVIRGTGGCGTRIVITPVDQASDGFRRMRAALDAR